MWKYIYADELYHSYDELYHYGVPGMKWGHRKAQRYERRTARKYARAGRAEGRADYYREQSRIAQKKHEDLARAFDKQARKSSKEGNIWRAEAAKKAAAAMRERGANVKAQHDADAKYYADKAVRNKEKASKYATKKRVDLGKNKVNSILKESRKKGYENQKAADEWQKEQDIRERYGDRGVESYNRLRGTS